MDDYRINLRSYLAQPAYYLDQARLAGRRLVVWDDATKQPCLYANVHAPDDPPFDPVCPWRTLLRVAGLSDDEIVAVERLRLRAAGLSEREIEEYESGEAYDALHTMFTGRRIEPSVEQQRAYAILAKAFGA